MTTPISTSPTSSPSASTSSLLRRVGSFKAKNDISERLGSLRMTSGRVRTRSTSNPAALFKNRSQPVTPVTPNTPVSPRFPRLRPPANAPRQDLPAWDRAIDAVCHSTINRKLSFEKVLLAFFKDHGRRKSSFGYFRLPDSVRLQICMYLLPDNDKPLRLNKYTFNRDVWRSQNFTSPYSTLSQLSPYLEVSFAFRADVLVTFLQQTRLHAVLSPFTGPRVSPLATTWLNAYGPYARNIVIELDMSHLGGGPTPGAENLLANFEKTGLHLQDFILSQLRRSGSCPLESLVLLCRRFYGKRPPRTEPETVSAASSRPSSRGVKTPEPHSPRGKALQRWESQSSDKLCLSPTSSCNDIPSLPTTIRFRDDYCPDSNLLFCTNILHLKGRIASIRMCGFSEDYTTCLIGSLFSDQKALAYRVTPSTIWPKLDGQKSYLDMGQGIIALDEHEVPASNNIPNALRKWDGCIQLPPPLIDGNGNLLLPPLVGELQQMRDSVPRSETSLSERTCEELLNEGKKKSFLSEKRGFAWLKEPFSKGKLRKKKRELTRDAATTY
ncbi:unnamed protein product [Fusarium langsethiae]|nr:unnamed protein product [Fusarium langsethiae]